MKTAKLKMKTVKIALKRNRCYGYNCITNVDGQRMDGGMRIEKSIGDGGRGVLEGY